MLLASIWLMKRPLKRPVVTAIFLFAVASLAGCPIYDHESDGCYRDSDCARNYFCDQHTGDCVSANNGSCTKPSDCDSTSTCTAAGVCIPGDCTFSGCVAGYRCDSSTGVWECVGSGAGAAGGSGDTGAAGQSSVAGQGGTSSTGAAGQGGQSAAAAGASDLPNGGA
jgi:hypothetical protein